MDACIPMHVCLQLCMHTCKKAFLIIYKAVLYIAAEACGDITEALLRGSRHRNNGSVIAPYTVITEALCMHRNNGSVTIITEALATYTVTTEALP